MLKKIISAAVAFMMLVPAFSAAARSETDMKTIKVDCGVSVSETDENGNGYGESGGIRVYSTLKGAKEYARTLDKTDGGVVIKIAGGFYYQSETIVFEPEDSNVRYEAEDPADPPVISGGYELSGAWEKDRETTNGTIYKIGLNRNKKLRSIYVNGKRAVMTKRDIEGTAASEEQYTVIPDETNSDWAWTSGTAAAGTIFPADTIPRTRGIRKTWSLKLKRPGTRLSFAWKSLKNSPIIPLWRGFSSLTE